MTTPSEIILRKNLVSSGLSSAEWTAMSAAVRDRAFFSSRGDVGQNEIVYWLVHKVRTRHDPSAMPDHRAKVNAATSAVRTAVQRILAR